VRRPHLELEVLETELDELEWIVGRWEVEILEAIYERPELPWDAPGFVDEIKRGTAAAIDAGLSIQVTP
jgi:hypothetical protein